MCTYVSKTSTRDLLKRIRENKTKHIKAWKIVCLQEDGKLHSKKYTKTWKAGVNKSNSRRSILPNFRDKYIDNGIHVYLEKPRCTDVWYRGGETILEVWCHADDLISASHNFYWKRQVAVFMKVYVTKGAIEKAKKVSEFGYACST